LAVRDSLNWGSDVSHEYWYILSYLIVRKTRRMSYQFLWSAGFYFPRVFGWVRFVQLFSFLCCGFSFVLFVRTFRRTNIDTDYTDACYWDWKNNSKILINVVSLHLVLVHPLSVHFLLRVDVCPSRIIMYSDQTCMINEFM
jgi:hypothetical protein